MINFTGVRISEHGLADIIHNAGKFELIEDEHATILKVSDNNGRDEYILRFSGYGVEAGYIEEEL